MRTEFAEIFKLGRAEKLQLVEDLWDSISDSADDAPISDEVVDELRRRKKIFDQHPETGLTWEQVKAAVREQHD